MKYHQSPETGKSLIAGPSFFSAQELICDDDRQWFADHPRQYLRIRHATTGDPPGTFVLVFCPLKNGAIRARLPFTPPKNGRLPSDETERLELLRYLTARVAPHAALTTLLEKVLAYGGRLPSRV